MDISNHFNGTPIYRLPGHSHRSTNGLGHALVRRGHDIVGQETVGVY